MVSLEEAKKKYLEKIEKAEEEYNERIEKARTDRINKTTEAIVELDKTREVLHLDEE